MSTPPLMKNAKVRLQYFRDFLAVSGAVCKCLARNRPTTRILYKTSLLQILIWIRKITLSSALLHLGLQARLESRFQDARLVMTVLILNRLRQLAVYISP